MQGASMLDRLAAFLGVSPNVAGMLLALVVLQVGTQVFALVDLARRDAVRGGKKWVWALVIAFGNLIGAIVYLAVGRHPDDDVGSAGSGASTAGTGSARRAVDTLYGRRDQR